MEVKVKQEVFGHCLRVLCDNAVLLPVGQTQSAGDKVVKTFCPRCQDVYHLSDVMKTRLENMHSEAIGPSFPHLFIVCRPDTVFPISKAPSNNSKNRLSLSAGHETYIPRIYGFKVHGQRGRLPSSFGDALGVYAKHSHSLTTSFGPCTTRKQLLQRNDSNPIFGAPFMCPPLVTNADSVPGGIPLYASNLLFLENSIQTVASSESPSRIGLSEPPVTTTPPNSNKRKVKESEFEVIVPHATRGSKIASSVSAKRYRSQDDDATVQSTDRVTLPMSTSMSSGGSLVSSGQEGASLFQAQTQTSKYAATSNNIDSISVARITPEIHDLTVFSDTNQALHSHLSVYRSSKRPLTSPYPQFKKPIYDDFDSPDENDREMESIVAEHEKRMLENADIATAVAAYAKSPMLESKIPEKSVQSATSAASATSARRSNRKRPVHEEKLTTKVYTAKKSK